MDPFRSLFLPLQADEAAVFASVFPLLLTFPSSIEGEAAAAAGESSARRQPAARDGGRATTADRDALAYSGGASSSLYSPTEGGGNRVEGSGSGTHSLRETAEEAQARRGAPLRSLVFAVGSSRADALLVVLRSQQVVVFGLNRVHSPPYELYRIRPLPTTHQLEVERKAALSSSSGRREAGSEACATCASLLPLAISYCCRIAIPAEQRGRRRSASGGGGSSRARHSPQLPNTRVDGAGRGDDAAEDDIYLRGLVGSSDGRVSVFSDVAYTMSFAAHEMAVVQVDAVLLPPCSLESDAHTSGGGTGGSARQGSQAASAFVGSPGHPSPSSSSASAHSRGSFQRAMQRLGIVSVGADGVVLLWRCLEGAMSPVILLRPSSFARGVPCAVHHPSALSALLAASAPASSREAAIDAELCCPPSCVVHATSRHAHGLRVRQLASLASAAGPQHSGRAALAATAGGADGAAEAGERAAPTWLSLPMPGSWTAAVTALATHHGVTLIARESTLFAMLRFDARAVTRVWRAESPITQLVMQDSLALAVCAKAGAVHVLSIDPATGQGAHQRSYYSYHNRPVHHVSLHAASMLMTIVDVCGSTELVQLPPDVARHTHTHAGGGGGDGAAAMQLLASMAALRAKVRIEEVKGAGGAASMYDANAALDALNERLLLARCAVPEECDRFLAAHEHVF